MLKEADKMWFKRKGQAATEFAVLGSLIIMAFAFLIDYSEKLNRQQAHIQQTFRAALGAAHGAGSVFYSNVVYRRMPNVSSPMELGELQFFSDSANVLWLNGISDNAATVYKFNGQAASLPPVAPVVPSSPDSQNQFINTVVATTTFSKSESGGVINTTKGLVASDILTANVTIDGAPYSFSQSLGAGGKYYSGTTNTLTRPGEAME